VISWSFPLSWFLKMVFPTDQTQGQQSISTYQEGKPVIGFPCKCFILLMVFPNDGPSKINCSLARHWHGQVVHLPSHLTTKDFVAAHWHHDRAGRRLKLPLGRAWR
jgi:hypothetical protein